MPASFRHCSRCGDDKADVWWNTAPFIPQVRWICSDCVNAVLLIWVMEHENLIDDFLMKEAAEHGHPGPA